MKQGQRLWTREELILAINLYLTIEFGKINQSNPRIIHLAKLIGRTPGSISFKLGNFGSFDPSLKNRGVGGLPNASKLDKAIWDEFYNNWEERAYESEVLRAKYEKRKVEDLVFTEDIKNLKGVEKERIVKVRVNQSLFRSMILASYSSSCCITGIRQTELLVASHIVPWSRDEENRMNPQNGLCLNALHDRAFDNYLLSITPEYKIMLSKRLKAHAKDKSILENFHQYEGKEIALPDKFKPEPYFLEHHFKEFKRRD